MATIPGIRGMLLEEVILFLLRKSGYDTVLDDSKEPDLLHDGHSGLELYGRGGKHQIDAVADFRVPPPFSNKLRLLLEAKFYTSKKVGIEVVRNAIGVLKDVSEFWTIERNRIRRPRYHYQYAIFSAYGFSQDALKYAYAHDIFLFDLSNSPFLESIIINIRSLNKEDFNADNWTNISVDQKLLRTEFREALKSESNDYSIESAISQSAIDKIRILIDDCFRIKYCFLATLGNKCPVFLTPSSDLYINNLIHDNTIRIYWNEQGWYIKDQNGNDLFTFYLPKDLLAMYASGGTISDIEALNLKKQYMSTINIWFDRSLLNGESLNYRRNIYPRDSMDHSMTYLELKLDEHWIDELIYRSNNG